MIRVDREHKFKWMMVIFWVLSLALNVSAPLRADAQSGDQKKSASGGKKNTTIDFEDQLVEGQAQKPELFYLLQKRQFNYKRMIRLRDDFLPEMRKTSEEIERKGSGL